MPAPEQSPNSKSVDYHRSIIHVPALPSLYVVKMVNILDKYSSANKCMRVLKYFKLEVNMKTSRGLFWFPS